MKLFKATLGLTALLAVGALTITATSTTAAADPQSCANLAPTINANMGTMVTTSQPMSQRTLAMIFSVNTLSDCLGFARPTPGCFVASANQVLPSAISSLSVISGIAQGFLLLNQSFPNQGAINFMVSQYNLLSFLVSEAASCTN